MRKFNFYIISIILLLTLFDTTYSQLNMTIVVSGGLSLPMADFKSDVPIVDTTREDWPYQLKVGYNFSAIGILPLNKQKNINLTFGITYTSFSNNIGVIDPSGADNNGVSGTSVTFMPRITMYTINMGGMYVFSPKKKFHPMLSLDVTGNFLTGNFGFDVISTRYLPTDLKSTMRIGLQLGGALEYQINNNYGIYFGIKYNLANLIGKTAGSTTQTVSVALGDKAYTTPNGVSRSSKTIAYLQMSLGAILYLNDNSEGK